MSGPLVVKAIFDKTLRHFVVVVSFMWVNTISAQSLQAVEDTFAIPSNEWLVVEEFGVLENDILDDEAAGELGATAVLVTNVTNGTLNLSPDGGFTYIPGPNFNGTDQFVYSAVFGGVTSQATVTLTACDGGPEIFYCWNKTAYMALANNHALPSFHEGFEDDAIWGHIRRPDSALSVSSRGFEWRANDFDPTHIAPPFPASPAPNKINTGFPGFTGMWAFAALGVGYSPLAGNITACDVVTPPIACYVHDGFTIKRETGSNILHGAGGYFNSINASGSISFVIDGDWQNPIAEMAFAGNHLRFFGVLTTAPVGFEEVQFREVSGIVGDPYQIGGDDFTLLALPKVVASVEVPSIGILGLVVMFFLLLTAVLWMNRKISVIKI